MDSKISSLTAETAPASADLGVIVDDVAGTPNTKKATLANIVTKGHGLSDGLVKVASGTMTQAVEDTDYQGVLAEGAFADGDKTKLDTVATGATANTGALADLDTVDTPQIDDDAVTYAKMQNVTATDRLLGRDTAGAGVVEELTPAAVRTMLNVVEDGATELGGLSDVTLTSPSDKDKLEYNGTNWVNVLGTNFKLVYNNTGGTLSQGTFVHITGSAGALPLVAVADKDTDTEVSGILTEDISAATSGVMQVAGTIQETFINTLGMTAGDPVYLSDTGAFTQTRPTAGNVIQIGVAGVIAASSGSLLLDCPATAITTDSISDDDKTGSDTDFVTGTAGASGNLVEWNADGDAVDSGSATSDFATAAQGTTADNALPKAGGTMTGAIVPADHGTATDPEVVAVVYGTSATPPTASTTPIGTLYCQYTA